MLLSTSSVAFAQTPAAEVTPVAADAQQRKESYVPHPVEAIPPGPIRFAVDPVGDGAMLGIAGAFDLLSAAILSTGEVRPQQIDPTFNTNQLLFLDRGAVSQQPDPHAATLSNIGLYSAIGFAVLDPILSGFRDGKAAALNDAVMYLEAIAFANGITDIAKVAVRRPRPTAYIERNRFIAQGGNPALYDDTTTDNALSFFSGHSSTIGAISGVATYLAFARSPHTARPWITLLAGIALTSFVSVERVRAAAHFPTDVIAGSLVGAATGVLVVHLHRADTLQQRPIWVGFQPMSQSEIPGRPVGGLLTLSGAF
ncbi:MAG: phosphatase PAP2 family protein [Polyangiaceae bacterium]